MKASLVALTLLLATPALADVLPVPDKHDPRLATLAWTSGNSFRLAIPVGGEVSVLLPPGEIVAGVRLDPPGDWAVTTTGSGQSLSVRPLRPLPDAVLTLTSSAREYHFVLSTSPGAAPPLVVRITGAPKAARDASPSTPAASESFVWALSGNRELRPSSIRDDGRKIYLDWPPSDPIPAVFAVDRLGREEMVNGFMRGGSYVIDRVYERLVFRIDKAEAGARRKPVRERK